MECSGSARNFLCSLASTDSSFIVDLNLCLSKIELCPLCIHAQILLGLCSDVTQMQIKYTAVQYFTMFLLFLRAKYCNLQTIQTFSYYHPSLYFVQGQ